MNRKQQDKRLKGIKAAAKNRTYRPHPAPRPTLSRTADEERARVRYASEPPRHPPTETQMRTYESLKPRHIRVARAETLALSIAAFLLGVFIVWKAPAPVDDPPAVKAFSMIVCVLVLTGGVTFVFHGILRDRAIRHAKRASFGPENRWDTKVLLLDEVGR